MHMSAVVCAAALLAAAALAHPAYYPSNSTTWDGGFLNPLNASEFPATTHVLHYTVNGAGVWTYSFSRVHKGTPIVNISVRENLAGWTTIQVTPDRTILANNPKNAYYASGFAEAYWTVDKIADVWETRGAPSWKAAFPAANRNGTQLQRDSYAFFTTQRSYVISRVANDRTAYGRRMEQVLAQIDGMCAGYAMAVRNGQNRTATPTITCEQFYFLNWMPDLVWLPDYITAMNSGVKAHDAPFPGQARPRAFGQAMETHGGTCYVRLSLDDIHVAHSGVGDAMWLQGASIKVYDFQSAVAMSSIAGSVWSADGFYMTSNKLAICSSRINPSSWQQLLALKANSVPTFLSDIVAASLSTSTSEYGTIVLLEDTSLLPSAHIVVDFKRVSYFSGAGGMLAPLRHGTAAIVQSVRLKNEYVDVSQQLHQETFLAIADWPVLPGAQATYMACPACMAVGLLQAYPRPWQIEALNRALTSLSTTEMIKDVMRHNMWRASNWSSVPSTFRSPRLGPTQCAGFAIAKRNDLNIGLPQSTSPFAACNPSTMTAYNLKIVSFTSWIGTSLPTQAATSFDLEAVFSPAYEWADVPPLNLTAFWQAYPAQKPAGYRGQTYFHEPFVRFNVSISQGHQVATSLSAPIPTVLTWYDLGMGLFMPIGLLGLGLVSFYWTRPRP